MLWCDSCKWFVFIPKGFLPGVGREKWWRSLPRYCTVAFCTILHRNCTVNQNGVTGNDLWMLIPTKRAALWMDTNASKIPKVPKENNARSIVPWLYLFPVMTMTMAEHLTPTTPTDPDQSHPPHKHSTILTSTPWTSYHQAIEKRFACGAGSEISKCP